MKRMLRGFCLIGVLLFVFVNIPSVSGSSTPRKVVYTAITNIEMTSFLAPELCENCTHFDFLIDYEILNPRIRKLTLTFPCIYNNLLVNATASFEDSNYILANADRWCLTAISQRTFDPGITSKKTGYRIGVLTPNLTELPNGQYNFVIYMQYWSPQVVFNETVMTVSDEGTSFQYGTLPPLNIIKQKRSLVIIHAGLVLAFFYVLIHKRRRKK